MAEALFEQLQRLQGEFHGHPPVHKWQPELCGNMDLVIRRDGRWVHEGSEIRRHPLVVLFASILKREGDDYFLVTPAEKWRIDVEDVPFIVTQVARKEKREGNGEGKGRHESVLFTTNTGDIVSLDRDCGWQLKPFGEPPQSVPYITVRDGLQARLSREVFYQLVEWALDGSGDEAGKRKAEGGEKGQLWLHSGDDVFLLGAY